MSALIFAVRPNKAIVATDTLVTVGEDLSPVAYMCKAYALPHLRALMVCTGWQDFGMRWFQALNGKFIAPSLEVLNQYAPRALGEIWKDFEAHGGTSTIYYFCAEDGAISAWAYRSRSSFKPERFPPEVYAFKPPIEGQGSWKLNDLSDIVRAMETQRADQDLQPLDERLGIGGEIIFSELNADGSIAIWVGHRFHDYEEQLAQMVDALPPDRR